MKLSVIVPVYGVEKYLDKCVQSLVDGLKGTNHEIILVDDGSPDNCPQMCDKWAEKESNVQVIHKQNGGLSDARNAGIEISTGDYLMFIDSDDFVSSSVKEVFSIISQSQDMSVYAFGMNNICGNQVRTIRRRNKSFVTSKTKDIKKFVRNETICHACIKVYKKSFITSNKLFFKKGALCEDLEMFTRMLCLNYKCCTSDLVYYNYLRQREGSIMTSFSYKTLDHIVQNAIENEDFISKHCANRKKAQIIKSYVSSQIVGKLKFIKNLSEQERKMLLEKLKKHPWLYRASYKPKHKIFKFISAIIGLERAFKILANKF